MRNNAEISDSLGIHAYLLSFERGMIEAEPVLLIIPRCLVKP
jgi:hypothetical protein